MSNVKIENIKNCFTQLNNPWKNYKYVDYLNVSINEIKDLPNNINISTMCTSCKLNCNINIKNIEQYLMLNENDILIIKLNKDKFRSLIVHKYESKKNKKINKSYFYNQITIVMRITNGHCDNINQEPKINMKLFKNGSIQMSGCKSINNINIALNKLIMRLSEIKATIEDNKLIEHEFIDSLKCLDVKNFKIDMINSNYKFPMHIDRKKLYNLLSIKKIKCAYEPCIRACVIIKFVPATNNLNSKDISIFVFQKGNIIITGAQNKIHLIDAYEYINDIITNHADDIIKVNDINEESLIFKLYEEVLKDIKLGLVKID